MPRKIVTAGDRVYMKFFDLDYFSERAKEADAVVEPCLSHDEEDFSALTALADAVVVIDRPVTGAHVKKMTRCRLILALEVGYDFIDTDACTEKGIVVSHVPAYCTREVACHAFSLILGLLRKMPQLMAETHAGGWDYKAGGSVRDTAGLRIGIVGLGRIGRTVVPMARAFGMEPFAYDPYVPDDIFELCGVSRCDELGDLLSTVDCVTLHVPLTDETRHMIGASELRIMKRDAVLVNTCRGKVVDGNALYGALTWGIIAGAGLDVLEEEPPPPRNPLLHLQNCIVTPHAAWYSERSLHRLKEQGMDEVIRVLNGGRPRFAVNPEALRRKNG